MAGPLDSVLGIATPVTNTITKVVGTLPTEAASPATPEKAGDLIEAHDAVREINERRRHPLWSRLLRAAVPGALVGGLGVGAKAGTLLAGENSLGKGVAAGVGIGALTGGGAAVANELFDHATEGQRLRRAIRRVKTAPTSLTRRLNDPNVAGQARDYQTARDYPLRLAELGAVAGGLGGAALGMHTTSPTTGDHPVQVFGVEGPARSKVDAAARYGLYGTLGVGALGLLGGLLYRHHQRRKLVDALTKQGADDHEPPDYDAKLKRLRARRTDLNQQLWRTLADGTRVYLVDGTELRNKVDAEFIGGGHPLVYPYVPDGEIWLDATSAPADLPFFLLHELVERFRMRRGQRYDPAHDFANLVEQWARRACQKVAMARPALTDPTPIEENPWPARNAPSQLPNTGGRPRRASNRAYLRGFAQTPERYAGGRMVTAAVQTALANLTSATTGTDATAPKLRSRAETVIYSSRGVLGIKHDDHLSFPGGGIDDGEDPECAAYREAIEEADRKLLHLKQLGQQDAVWPDDQQLVDGFDGFRNYLFLALDGGTVGTTHEDNEDFTVIPFADAIRFLRGLVERDDLGWSKEMNQARLQAVEEAQTLAEAGHVVPAKLAALTVPAQATDYHCGPACLSGLLKHVGIDVDQNKLAGQLGTNATDGTVPDALVRVAGDHGLHLVAASSIDDHQLRQHLAAARPVLMLINSHDDGVTEDHYVVATGLTKKGVQIADPYDDQRRVIPFDDLDGRWKSTSTTRWGAAAQFPKTAAVNQILAGSPAQEAAPTLTVMADDEPDHTGQTPAVLVDLDQTVRTWPEDKVSRGLGHQSIMPNRKETLGPLKALGMRIIGVTNHSCYGGDHDVTPDQLLQIQHETIGLMDGLLDDVCYCPVPDPDVLKPAPTMLLHVIKRYGIDPAACVMVGDNVDHDGGAAEAAGIPFMTSDRFFADPEITIKTIGHLLHPENQKTADAVTTAPRSEHILLNQAGQVYVAPDQNRRYRFPGRGNGRPAPYEPAQRFLPPGGVPEPGVHGYDLQFHVGDQADQADDFPGEWRDSQQVLKDLYASMGLKVNQHHREADRARARVIMRALRGRAKQAPPAVPPVPPVPPAA